MLYKKLKFIDVIIYIIIFNTLKMVKHLGILVDASGSMEDMNPTETVQALNKNIQRVASDDTSIFVAKFSDDYELIINNEKKQNVNLELQDIAPDGLTALYDGINNICRDITNAAKDVDNNDITIIILTDGQENASQTANISNVRKLLRKYEL